MDYHANVDTAAEEAILGPQRNTSRNKPDVAEGVSGGNGDATAGEQPTCENGSSLA
jgi:hypothetical protein